MDEPVDARLHLIKLAVGVEGVDHLARLQAARARQNASAGLSAHPRHITRQRPRREHALLDGGSIYWVIRGQVRARQRILALESFTDEEGIGRCAFVLDPQLHETRPLAYRAFQGWRYLDPAKAPPDGSGSQAENDVPGALAEQLRVLGLM